MNLELSEGMEFIHKAYDQELEERLWQQWLAEIPLMTKDSSESFDEYKKTRLKPRVNRIENLLSKEDLLLKADSIKEKINISKEVTG